MRAKSTRGKTPTFVPVVAYRVGQKFGLASTR